MRADVEQRSCLRGGVDQHTIPQDHFRRSRSLCHGIWRSPLTALAHAKEISAHNSGDRGTEADRKCSYMVHSSNQSSVIPTFVVMSR